MNPDPFEKDLSRRKIPMLPSFWREQILDEALKPVSSKSRSSFLGRVQVMIQEWMSPTPRAWGALACVWVVILLLSRLPGPDAAPHLAGGSKVSTGVEVVGLKQQQQLMAELMADLNGPASIPAKAVPMLRNPHSTLQTGCFRG